MVKHQGKLRQSNIFEPVAKKNPLKNLMGGVHMCFELMAAPFPSQGNNSTLLWNYNNKNEGVKKKSFIEVRCKPVAFHYNTQVYKNSTFPFL